MRREDREQLAEQIATASALADRAAAILKLRADARTAVQTRVENMRSRAINISREEQNAWRVVPLVADDEGLASDLAALRDLPALSEDSAITLAWLQDVLGGTAMSASPLAKRRLFAGRKKFDDARAAAAALPEQLSDATARNSGLLLDELESAVVPRVELPLQALADPTLAFSEHFAVPPSEPELVASDAFDGLAKAITSLDRIVAKERADVAAAKTAGHAVREADVRDLLEAMPLDTLKQLADGSLPIRVLTGAGITSVQDVLDRQQSLMRIQGIGHTTARRTVGAAVNLQQITREDTPVRIDINTRDQDTTNLLEALRTWDGTRVTTGAATDLQRAADLREFSAALDRRTRRWLVTALGPAPAATLIESVNAVVARAASIKQTTARGVGAGDVWEDFLARPADYFALLAELGFLTEDAKKAHGNLPEEIIEAVRAFELRTDNIRASLRAYQSFAARFALVQDKVIIGDEMGLGKTVEALAALAHLKSTGESHFLVVCPAAVVSNWMRETTRHTTLRPHRVHGAHTSRVIAVRNWARGGGVAVTTFDMLQHVTPYLERVELACVIVDEAHYIKNPRAQRSQRTGAILQSAPRAVVMSGTPLENRVEEFRNLISYIHPDLAKTAPEISPVRFREHVAPVYLRRNQEDVLTELPELVEVDEWLGMSTEDRSNYLDAVIESNFTAMRRAAMLDPHSEKLNRLREIVAEAEANGRRVIVYSYFLDVLSLIATELPGHVFGPLTGRVPAIRRQEMVDAFSAADHGAVLVSQIIAGGVGLNIQSASVVVICEPQLKPTTESQAIARAHRMGQVQTVQVHRLLSEDSVDERILEILARKKELFDAFARESAMADSAPEAIDVSEVEMAREIVAAERVRLLDAEENARRETSEA